MAKKQILLIDNDADFIEMMETVLTDAGFCVNAFTEVDDIFKLIEDYKPDIILLDYLLRGVNGGDLCSQIKRSPKTNDIPVILISAYFRVLLSLGTYDCDEFIEKPFEITHLIDRVNFFLKKNKPRYRRRNYIKVEFNKNSG